MDALALIICCRWFLLCENVATHVARHPRLGDVPICERCARVAGVHVITREQADDPTDRHADNLRRWEANHR